MTTRAQIKRLLLALDPDDWPALELDAVTRLAAGLTAEVEGLYIEDLAITQAVQLSATRIVSSYLGTTVRLDERAMSRAIRARAETTRARLEAAARRWTASCRFEIAHGEVSDAITQRIRAEDLIVLRVPHRRHGQAMRQRELALQVAREAPCAVMLFNPRTRAGRSILAVYEGDDDVLQRTVEIARIYGAPYGVLVVSAQDPSALIERTAERLRDHQVPAGLHSVTGNAALLAAVRALQPDLVIAAHDGLVAHSDLLADLTAETSVLILH